MTKESAEKKALAALNAGSGIVLQKDKTEERAFGWVFYPVPKKYLETKNPSHLIPGLGPVAVTRGDGKAHLLSTSVSPSAAIETFEAGLREGSEKAVAAATKFLKAQAPAGEYKPIPTGVADKGSHWVVHFPKVIPARPNEAQIRVDKATLKASWIPLK
jgi:hypothetical protein